MSVTISVNPSPTSKADGYKVYNASGLVDSASLVQGSVLKGTQNQTIWIMFEPNLPEGSTLVSANIDLWMTALGGTNNSFLRVGWFANDGTWNVQASNLGLGEYAVFSLTGAPGVHPTRLGASDAKWINSVPSFNPLSAVLSSAPASGTAFSIGGGSGISPTYADADFVSDAQDAFDSNETNRTARGVPMLMTILPTDNAAQQWILASNEDTTSSRRPLLTLVYNPPSIAAAITSTAVVNASALLQIDVSSNIASSASVSASLTLVVAPVFPISGKTLVTSAISASSKTGKFINGDVNFGNSINASVYVRKGFGPNNSLSTRERG